ncbi:MAG: acetylornithine transaminase, partial [Methanobacteriaceae archaeon]
ELDSKYIIQTYGRQPIALSHGKGAKVWDAEGNEYLDCFAGVAVNCLGHCHPNIVSTIKNQAERMIHCSNIYYTKEQSELAEALIKISPNDKVFFANSGAEANEGAIKIARKFTGKGEIIATNNSFHGRTLATVTATGQDKYKEAFKPLPAGFVHVDYNDIDAVANAINENTAAVIVEPIQGEGGVIVPNDDYLPKLRGLCSEKGVLLILDEVQTGFGRCGKMFASEWADVKPDITTVAKGLGGGIPIGAILANEDVASAFVPGDHGSTFGGNPLVCAVAKTVIETLLNDNLIKETQEKSSYFIGKLDTLKEKHDNIIGIRGKGLLIGLEFNTEEDGVKGADIVSMAREKGFLINNTADNVLRFAPPLIITKDEIDSLVAVLDEIFTSKND